MASTRTAPLSASAYANVIPELVSSPLSSSGKNNSHRAWHVVSDMFWEFERGKACGDERLLEHAKRILREGKTAAHDSVKRYVDQCGDAN